jgi:hypothetical protein
MEIEGGGGGPLLMGEPFDIQSDEIEMPDWSTSDTLGLSTYEFISRMLYRAGEYDSDRRVVLMMDAIAIILSKFRPVANGSSEFVLSEEELMLVKESMEIVYNLLRDDGDVPAI